MTEIELWVATLDARACARYGAALDAGERARAERLDGAVRRRFVARRGLRRAILARCLGCAPGELRFTHGPGGRPELAGRRDLRFGCSSSGDLAHVAVARDRDVGIDVERLRTVAGALAIAEELLGTAARDELRGLPEPDRSTAFLRRWTGLEARVKATGAGLTAAAPDAGALRIAALDPAPGHVAALAAAGADWRVRRRTL